MSLLENTYSAFIMSEKQHLHKGFGTLGPVEKTFRWVINDLVVNLSKSKITSPKFAHRFADNTSTKWFLELVPLTLPGNKKYMAISMTCSQLVKLNAVIDIALFDSFNNEIFRNARSNMDFTIGKSLVFYLLPMEMFVNERFSSNDNNKFTLVLTFLTNQYSEMKIHRATKERSRLDCLNSFAKLVNNKQFSDVILDVQGEELYAYKGILASRSPVFLAMFTHNMTEMSCSRVTIEDISYSTMYDLLHFIYTGLEPKFACDEAQERCKNLLIAADKYGLEKLKLQMEGKLMFDIQVCNVFEYLNFADSYNAAYLKEKAIEFIISHNDEIAGSEVYKKFSDLHPNVSCEVFHSLLIKRRKLE